MNGALFLRYYVAGQTAAVLFAGALCPAADPAALSPLMQSCRRAAFQIRFG